MQKFIDLLSNLGASEDLAKTMVEELQAFEKQTEGKWKAKYDSRLDEVKKLCIAYTESHILKLANSLKVFMEAKERDFAEAAERQVKLAESEAVVTLKKVSEALGGGEAVAEAETLRERAALRKTVERLEKAFSESKKEGQRLAQVANRANEVAGRSLREAKRYRALARRAGLEDQPVAEGRKPQARPGKQNLTEGRKPAPKGRTIGESRRRSAQPKTGQPAGRGGHDRALKSSDPLINRIAESL